MYVGDVICYICICTLPCRFAYFHSTLKHPCQRVLAGVEFWDVTGWKLKWCSLEKWRLWSVGRCCWIVFLFLQLTCWCVRQGEAQVLQITLMVAIIASSVLVSWNIKPVWQWAIEHCYNILKQRQLNETDNSSHATELHENTNKAVRAPPQHHVVFCFISKRLPNFKRSSCSVFSYTWFISCWHLAHE